MRRHPALRKISWFVLTAALAACFSLPAAGADRVPNDPYYSDLWYLKKIGVPEAWNSTLGFEGVTVAVIDSGVDIDHPDLKDNIWHNLKEIPGNNIDDDGNGYVDDYDGWNFVNNNNDPRPVIGSNYTKLGVSHGTINAGVIAARGDNGKGIVGVTWQTKIMALRALDSSGGGDPVNIVKAVEYAAANGAKVINLSFTGQAKDELLGIALRRAYDAGVFVVVAAGNAPDGGEAVDLDKNPLYPVCLDRDSDENFVYGVTATDENDKKASFANYGAGCVDISAPGTRVIAAQFYRPTIRDFELPYGGYYNGTSLAAPVIAGTVALLRSLDYTLTPKRITNILTQTAVNVDALNPGFLGKLGRGRVNAAAAVALVLESHKVSAAARTETTASLLPPESGRRVIIAAPGPGRRPEIRLFTPEGLFIRGFDAFPAEFRGGVNLAVGDFDGSGKQSIVAGAGPGGGPQIRVFNVNTQVIGGFFAYDSRFRGGVSVAAGDVDGDGKDEIISGAGPGGGPQVRLFRAGGGVIGGFFAFSQSFRGGVSVAAGDVDGDGKDEIIAASGSGMPTTVRVFDRQGRMLDEFRPFGDSHKSGAAVAAADMNADGRDDLAVTPLKSGAGAAGVFNVSGERLAAAGWSGPALVDYPAATAKAARPAIMPGAKGSVPTVTLDFAAGSSIQFYAFEKTFSGGIRLVTIE